MIEEPMDTKKQATIDDFLANVSPEARAALEQLRGWIREAAPDAVETIAYGVPAFKYRGRPFVSFGATQNHCAFYVQSPAVMEAHGDELATYDTSKGTVRFTPDAPLPRDLVMKLVKARMAEIDGSSS
jgi:uncharacterized protein YdhG (YjbR/CyaY superfamily)